MDTALEKEFAKYKAEEQKAWLERNLMEVSVNADFKEILSGLSEQELFDKIFSHVFQIDPEQEDEELISDFAQQLTNEQFLLWVFSAMPDEMKEDFDLLLKEDYVSMEQLTSRSYQTWGALGYLYATKVDGKFVIFMPKEVKAALKNRDSQLFEDICEQSRKIETYMAGLVEVYGICSMEQVEKIYRKYENDEIGEGIFELYAKVLTLYNDNYHMENGMLIHEAILMGGDEEIEEMEAMQEGKPYYVPTKEEIVRAADYSAEPALTQELNTLLGYISENIVVDDPELAMDIVDDISLALSMEFHPESIFHEFSRRNIVLKDAKTVNNIMKLAMDAYNNTRLWENRGHTPKEMHSLMPNRFNRSHMPATSQKVGRNEPCPCGSGKKYKKCCG
ncbi:MAG: SEC-C metal-binding domain-containing protein [Turicibacter sp.]|nr:SEC-C metal-binding domain-containing protein [Turicibacter sp.]